MVELTEQPIDTDSVLRSVNSVEAGANVLFVGTTRQYTGDQETVRLEYDGYREMAMKELTALRDAAMAKWPIVACTLVHRLGTVELGEASVAVAVSTPHRKDCFEAATWIMDNLKQKVPIWKQEHGTEGKSHWVHPSTDAPRAGDAS